MRTRARTFLARFSYANIMSTFAVFLVLSGGAAYAANTIRTADIVNNQVYSADVRDDTLPNGGLTSADIGTGQVGASELGQDSVAFSELAFGTLPSFTYNQTGSSATDTTVAKEVQVTCNNRSTDEVTGGGFVIAQSASGGNVPGVLVERSYAVSSNTWLVRAFAETGTPSWQLTVTANCIG